MALAGTKILKSDLPYQEGTIKLTWIKPSDYTILNSKMFDSVEDALISAKDMKLGTDFLIMKLKETDGNQYQWVVLPYGDYKPYVTGMKISDSPIIKYGSLALMGLGVVYLVNLISKKR